MIVDLPISSEGGLMSRRHFLSAGQFARQRLGEVSWFVAIEAYTREGLGNGLMRQSGFSAPGVYRIEVQGHLPSGWAGRLGGMRPFSPTLEPDSEVTFLQGEVSDQAELTGILTSLYELQLRLMSVQYLGNEPRSATRKNDA